MTGDAFLSAEVTDLLVNWLLPQKGSAVQSGESRISSPCESEGIYMIKSCLHLHYKYNLA